MSTQLCFPMTLAIALACVPCPSMAQPVFEQPTYLPGDWWQYNYVSESDGTSGQFWRRIERIFSDDRIEVRASNGRTEYFDGTMNYVGEKPEDQPRVFVKFPLHVGDSWTFVRQYEDNPQAGEQGWVEVVGFERITVPAGAFDCFRIEIRNSGTSQMGTTDTHLTQWHCPLVKWLAREIRDVRVTVKYGLGQHLHQISELTRYTPGQTRTPPAQTEEERAAR